jgi:hypothetical protein
VRQDLAREKGEARRLLGMMNKALKPLVRARRRKKRRVKRLSVQGQNWRKVFHNTDILCECYCLKRDRLDRSDWQGEGIHHPSAHK